MIMYNLTADKFATLTSIKKVQNINRTTSSDILTVVLCRERNTLKENCPLKSSCMLFSPWAHRVNFNVNSAIPSLASDTNLKTK